MKGVITVLLTLLFSGLMATGLQAATYTLPADAGASGSPFEACTVSDGDVNCSGNVIIGNNDDILLSQDVNLSIAGDLNIGNNTEINPDDLFTFDISVGGNLTAGNTLSFNANLQSGGDINLGNGAVIGGDLTAGGNINSGNNTNVDGNLTAGGDINLGNNSQVNGQCSASGGNYPEFCDNGNGDEDLVEIIENTPGLYSFTVPEGVNEITVEAWGSGGRGGDARGPLWGPFNQGSGGGGGGAYASQTLAVTPGEVYYYLVGDGSDESTSGESWFADNTDGSTPVIFAPQGQDVSENATAGGAGGDAAAAIGSLTYSGGDGANSGTGEPGGGGGASATPQGDGVSATGQLGAIALDDPPDGGSGGNGADSGSSQDGSSGQTPGGGGGGSAANCGFFCFNPSQNGGGGGNGQIRITYDGSDVPGDPETCFFDSFNRSELGEDWVTSTSSGSFIPQIVQVAGEGRLRMTEAAGDQATAATLQRLIPAEGNRVELEFDYYAYDGTGADGLTIVLSDAEVTPQPGGFGGSLGYANRTGVNGFAGGWLGIGLDEFGNFSNPTEGRNGGTGFVNDAVAVRGAGQGENGYEYLVGTDSLSPGVDATGETVPHRYRIVIDSRTAGQATLRIERDVGDGSGFQVLINDFDVLNDASTSFPQSPVPQDFLLSLTGSTGGSTNIHEFGAFEICADELNPVDLQIDHFEFDFPTSEGLTCQASSIEIRACLDENCDEQLDQPFSATLVPDSGWAGGNQVESFNSGDRLDFLPAAAGTYSFDVTGSSPPTRPLSQSRCFVNGVEQANCDYSFSDSGFLFFDAADASIAIGLAELIAGETSDTLYVRPVTTDPETGVCNTVFAEGDTVEVETGTVCDDPSQCSSDYQVAWIDDAGAETDLPNPENPESSEVTRPVEWTVGANATTAFQLRSPDVGLQTLDLRYVPEDIDGNPAPDNAIEGAFQIRSRPAEIQLVQIASEDGVANPGAESPTGDTFVRAGEPFTTELMALDIDGQITPGFSAVDGLFRVYWDDSAVQLPIGGAGALTAQGSSFTQASHWEDVPGDPGVIRMTATAPRLQFDEVGIVTARARIENFLGGPDLTSAGTAVGRFIPYDIRYELEMVPNLAPAQGNFTYQGQPFSLVDDGEVAAVIRVTAENLSGERTINYADDFFNSPASVPSDVSKDSDTMETQAELSLQAGNLFLETRDIEFDPDKDYSGELIWPEANLPQWQFMRVAAEELNDDENPQGKSLLWTIEATDLEDTEVCTATRCSEADGIEATITGGELVYGRIRLVSAQGPEGRPLQMPVRAEIWNLGAFELFDAEAGVNQTGFPEDENLVPDMFTLTALGDFDADTLDTFAWSGFGEDDLAAGEGRLTLAGGDIDAGPDMTGRVRVVGDGPEFPLYLHFDWPYADGVVPPRAIASFGTYEGRPPVLFMLPQGR